MKYLAKAGVARLTKKPDDSGYEIAPPPTKLLLFPLVSCYQTPHGLYNCNHKRATIMCAVTKGIVCGGGNFYPVISCYLSLSSVNRSVKVHIFWSRPAELNL